MTNTTRHLTWNTCPDCDHSQAWTNDHNHKCAHCGLQYGGKRITDGERTGIVTHTDGLFISVLWDDGTHEQHYA